MAANVTALYPSLCRDTATKALESALETHSTFNTKTHKIIVELNKICLVIKTLSSNIAINTQK